MTEDHYPADLTLTEQQRQQCREVLQFLASPHHFLSLYGNYGYGKTIVLTVATDMAAYQVEEVNSYFLVLYSYSCSALVFTVTATLLVL